MFLKQTFKQSLKIPFAQSFKYPFKQINKSIISNISIKSFSKLTHTGPSKMVNIGDKTITLRYAKASCKVKVNNEVLRLIKDNENTKGDVLRIAEIAGITGGKKTSSLVRMYLLNYLNYIE